MTDQLARLSQALATSYRIERELGAGGMATVYLAVDLRHQRPVAVKVLRPELAAVLGADRFLQEIRVTANLQHPHILPLFDSGETNGFLFYVMPYVEGESLRHRLQREGQLPVEEAIRIATEVANGLDYAHRHGLIHRDIKPENILLNEGRALIADFGIALAVQTAGGGRLTESGLSLGTPAYMSPEQAAGDRQLDPRTDVYSLGCVTYEMLAGEPPHQGPTAQAIVARIMTEMPRSLAATRPTLPGAVTSAVHRALQRSPADRFGGAGDFAKALVATSTGEVVVTRPNGIWIRRLTTVGSAIGLLAVGVIAGRLMVGDSSNPPQRIELYLETDSTNQLDETAPFPLRISRDGRRVVYVGRSDSGRRLYVRSLSEAITRAIPGTEGATIPAISPDGDSVAWVDKSSIWKIALTGGAPALLAGDLANDLFNSLDWGPGGWLVYGFGKPARVFTVSSSGGEPTRYLGADSLGCYRPIFFRDDRAILAFCNGGLTAFSSPTGSPKHLIGDGYAPRHIADGIVYLAGGASNLYLQRFNSRTLAIDASRSLIHGDIESFGLVGADYDVSETGTLVHVPRRPNFALALVNQDGTERTIRGTLGWPRFSPSGDRLLSASDSTYTVSVTSVVNGSSQHRLYQGQPIDPAWSPDGKRVLYSSNQDGDYDLWSARVDGDLDAKSILRMPGNQVQASFSSDGAWIVFVDQKTESNWDLAALRTTPNSTAEVLFTTPWREAEPTLSPDGRWLGYVSNETGNFEVYVRPFARKGSIQRISVEGGGEPVWSGDGRGLYYRHGSQVILAALRVGDAIEVRDRRIVFDRPGDVSAPGHRFFDVSRDGSQFAFETRPGRPRIIVTLSGFRLPGSSAPQP